MTRIISWGILVQIAFIFVGEMERVKVEGPDYYMTSRLKNTGNNECTRRSGLKTEWIGFLLVREESKNRSYPGIEGDLFISPSLCPTSLSLISITTLNKSSSFIVLDSG